MQLSYFLILTALVLYGLATVVFAAHMMREYKHTARIGMGLLLAGLLAHAAHALRTGSLDTTGWLAFGIGLIVVIVTLRYPMSALGVFAAPLVFLSFTTALFVGVRDSSVHIALKSYWFPLHVSAAIVADALLAVAGLAAIMYLLQDHFLKNKQLHGAFHKFPSIHVLDDVSLKLLSVGFLFMTIGMCAGAFLARQYWGTHWYEDPRQIWSFCTWLILGAMLSARFFTGFRGRRAAFVTVFAVTCIFGGLFSLNYFNITKHNVTYMELVK